MNSVQALSTSHGRTQSAQSEPTTILNTRGQNARAQAQEFLNRFEADGVAADIEAAIRIHHQTLDQRGSGHPERDEPLCDLAECLRKRFFRQSVTADLHEAISLAQAALKLCPVGHPNRPDALGELGVCLNSRFQSYRNLADLYQAISLLQDALDLCPAEHPKRFRIVFNLALAFRERFGLQHETGDLDKMLSLFMQALELCHVGDPNWAPTLGCIASCLRLRSEFLGVAADLEESIFHFRTALELLPEGHAERSMVLNNLANALQVKGTAADLDEAVSLYKAASELCLVGQPLRPVFLNGLASSLESRFDLRDAIADLNEAIDIRWTLVESHPSEDSKQSFWLERLADCLEARYRRLGQFSDLDDAMKIRQELSDPHPSCQLSQRSNDLFHIKPVIAGIVQEILEVLPPRLLHTLDGIICDRAMQVSMFQDSLEYSHLLRSTRTISQCDIDNVRIEVAKYFRYATLSHRWGEEEPLLEHVAGGSIYDDSTIGGSRVRRAKLDGFRKLQNFCDVTRRHGFYWAWSDTCCINKSNNVTEVQEAIGSMFSWYQRSALTIVYLADIAPNAGPGELSSSEWFRRGWTLQELLASSTILFYSKNWSLYLADNSPNHKQSQTILAELERTTAISYEFLTNFHPGMKNARQRLQWASRRRTTHPEDIAYSLFGIFNLHLPILYGEGKEKAVGRLLQEIISQSGDTSILDWTGKPSSFHSCFPANITSYRFSPSVQPPMGNIAFFERSLLRLQELIDREDACRFYWDLMALPFPHFANCRLLLPCIVHRVQSITFKHMAVNHHVYEAQATNLRPLLVASLDELVESTSQKSPYVIVRVLDQNLLDTVQGNEVDAAYKIMVELDRPFSALLLEQISRRAYCRVASSRTIIARIDDSKDIASSEVATLNII